MIWPEAFYSLLHEHRFRFYAGVPDSLLKEICACITDKSSSDNHVITANEGAAVALAAGHYLGSGEAGLVYMQNSGTGNAINPLLSLADPDVYGIPMLVMIGWRGEPGVKDEPQHVKQGRVQEDLIRALGYRYEILEPEIEPASRQVAALAKTMNSTASPVVLLVRAGSFDAYPGPRTEDLPYPLTREQALQVLVDASMPDDRFVSTTGKTSRELFEIRQRAGQDHARDFLTVGSMGHALMISFGLARTTERSVYCIDGDGAALMHLGSMAVAGLRGSANLRHVLINNGAHESVGGQPTVGFEVPFHEIAAKLGYRESSVVTTEAEIRETLTRMSGTPGPHFLEIRVRPGSRKDLGRPTTTPKQNKEAMMKGLRA